MLSIQTLEKENYYLYGDRVWMPPTSTSITHTLAVTFGDFSEPLNRLGQKAERVCGMACGMACGMT